MFERAHHRAIEAVLRTLDAQVLRERHCYFGGGTAMALRYGEYRESVDIDFLISDHAAFRDLRQLLGGADGLSGIVRTGLTLELAREVRIDRYGIRTHVRSGASLIKLGIVNEDRIELTEPAATDVLCGVPCLTPIDLATEKLLANADRWADTSVFSRDLIDLAMQALPPTQLKRACEKAERSFYGKSIRQCLHRAVGHVRRPPEWLPTCLRAMRMTGVTPAQVMQSILRVQRILPLPTEDVHAEK